MSNRTRRNTKLNTKGLDKFFEGREEPEEVKDELDESVETESVVKEVTEEIMNVCTGNDDDKTKAYRVGEIVKGLLQHFKVEETEDEE